MVRLLFVESLEFTEALSDYFPSDDAYRAFQSFIMENPEAGAVISQAGGLRKVRWTHAQHGKGKRGGLRIIYLYMPDFERLLLVDVYGKDEKDDLTIPQRRQLATLADEYRKWVRQTRGGKRREQP